MKRPGMFQQGFTLIEMLLVVALNVLLISILLPSIRKAREHADVALRMHRLSQVVNAATACTASNQNRCAVSVIVHLRRAPTWLTGRTRSIVLSKK